MVQINAYMYVCMYACMTQVFKLFMPHLADVAALNTVYRRHVLDPTQGLAESLSLGDRGRGLCAKFISERLHSIDFQMFDQRQNFAKLGPHADSLHGLLFTVLALVIPGYGSPSARNVVLFLVVVVVIRFSKY